MLLIHGDEKVLADLDDAAMRQHLDEYWAYDDAPAAVGAFVDSASLAGAAEARIVGPGGVVSDGPFAETSEVLGGYYIIDVADEAAAVEWAHKVPGVVRGFGRVEVRAIQDMQR
jgi:hypothetical protein